MIQEQATVKNNIIDKTEELKLLVGKVKQFQLILTNAEKVFSSMDDDELRVEYLKEMKPLVKDYEKAIIKTKFILEEQFKWERQENIPINFNYRKMHKVIVQEFNKFMSIKGF